MMFCRALDGGGAGAVGVVLVLAGVCCWPCDEAMGDDCFAGEDDCCVWEDALAVGAVA
jgi:hypothetical protein